MYLQLLEYKTEVLVGCLVLIVTFLFKYIKRTSNDRFPPGPIGLPIVGYIPFMTKHPQIKLQKLGKKYGDVFCVKFGPFPTVILHSAKSIREGLSKSEILGRPDDLTANITDMKTPLFSSGKLWLEHRRLTLRALRDLGLGKSRVHELLQQEIHQFLKEVEKGGNPCDIKQLLTSSTSNNICSLIFGKRYDYDEPDRVFLDTTLSKSFKYLKAASALIFFPWMKKIPIVPWLLRINEYLALIESFNNFIKKKIDEHVCTLDEDNPRDFIDIYLSEMRTRREKDPDTTVTEDCLPGNVQTLFSAGGETVRMSVEWALYMMAAKQDIQKKVQKHLDNVIGTERNPSNEDMKNLPYVQAVITEMQRWKTIAVFGPLRRATEEVELFGYILPKNTFIMPHFWAAHNDEEVWTNPKDFIPERFITDEKFLVKNENYLPFSCGKRACPGEGLALTEIFLYFTTILQKFNVEFSDSIPSDFYEQSLIVNKPITYKLNFTSRI